MSNKVISFGGNTECPDCHLPLVLKQTQSLIEYLDKDGKVVDEYHDYDIYLQCEKCLHRFNPIKVGDNYKIYTNLEEKLDIYNMIKNLDGKSPFIKGDD